MKYPSGRGHANVLGDVKQSGLRLGRRLLVAPLMFEVAAGIVGVSSAAAAASKSSAKSAGTLTMFIQSPPTSLNPPLSTGQGGQLNADIAYSSLLELDTKNQNVPALVKGYRFIGKGNKEFQLTLRNGVRFSDGSTLTAQAVKANILYDIKTAAISPASFPLKKVTTPNAHTVDVFFTAPMPFAADKFQQAGGIGSPISPKELRSKAVGYETFGAGPYMLDSKATTTGSIYTYVKNPYYFDKTQQRWGKVVIKVIADPNSAIEAAGATANSFALGATTENAAAKAAGLAITPAAYTLNYGMLLLDRGGQVSAPLGNAQVRQALNYAINRGADAKALGGEPTEQLIAPGFLGHYSPNLYSYDPAKAKQLLAAAGYPKGFSFSAVVNSSDPTAAQTAQILVSNLAQIGVTLTLVSTPNMNQFGTLQASKTYPASIAQLPSNEVSFLALTVLPGGFFNVFNAPAPTSNYLAQYNAAGTKSGAAETAAWAQLGREAAEYAWSAPVVVLPTPYYASKNLVVPKSWGPTPDPVYFKVR
jgi:peptide/nickel transport system substrate-binding protein